MTPDQITEQIRAEVFEKAEIRVSAGIAPNAKVIHFLHHYKIPLIHHILASKNRLKPKQAKWPICNTSLLHPKTIANHSL